MNATAEADGTLQVNGNVARFLSEDIRYRKVKLVKCIKAAVLSSRLHCVTIGKILSFTPILISS